MKKIKKNRRFLSSFICLINGSICLSIGLSSCVLAPNDDKNNADSEDSIVTPPNDDNNNDNIGDNNDSDDEKPIEPNKPEDKPPINNEPNKPESNNPIEPPSGNLINKNSINLKEYGQLLPSQYLHNINDLNDLKIDKTKIIENFNKNEISEIEYSVYSLNDKSGNLSIKMKYKNMINDNIYQFIFNFSNLSKLEDQNYSLFFNVENKNLLNAKEISSKLINSNEDAKLFFEYLKLSKTNLIFRNNTNELSINYLNFKNGIKFSGFNDNWYTSKNDIELNVRLRSLKINSYIKERDSNSLSIIEIDYPSNLAGSNRKPISLICPSALDYLLEKIVSNDDYVENKFASYYYYDIVINESFQTQLQLTNDKWLKNVQNIIDGYNIKKYKPVISKTINPKIDNEGNLVIQIQMQLSDEEIYSKNTKELVIKSFLKLNDDLFYYSGNKNNKFSLYCDINNKDKILTDLKKHDNFSKIKKEIEDSTDEIIDISNYFNQAYNIKIKNFIELYFDSSKIVKDDSLKYYSSLDKKISIKHYDINPNEIKIQYDKNIKCFQIKCRLAIECEGLENNLLTSDYMTVNITNINASLE